jgi:hypothetical protein
MRMATKTLERSIAAEDEVPAARKMPASKTFCAVWARKRAEK